jgi:hypothetical protein
MHKNMPQPPSMGVAREEVRVVVDGVEQND